MKKFAYRVTESTCDEVKVGAILLYEKGRGPRHFETIIDTNTYKMIGGFSMEKIGPCWVVGGKVQFEKPPLAAGELTRKVMEGGKI